jgi:hypothetical protein
MQNLIINSGGRLKRPLKIGYEIALFVVATIIVVSTSGCSLIGLGIGAVVDHSRPDSLSIPGWKAETLKPKEEIKITFQDGSQLNATYKGIERLPSNKYAQRYGFLKQQNLPGVILPPLGDTIGITRKSGESVECELLGFDYRYQPTETKGANESSPFTSVLVSLKFKGNVVAQNLSSTEFIKISDSEGNVLETEVLQRLATEGKIPFMSALSVDNSDRVMLISRETVSRIEKKNNKNAKLIGLRIGAAIDVTVLIFLAVTFHSISTDWTW